MLNSYNIGDLVTYDYDFYEQSYEKNLIPPIGSVGKIVGRGQRGPQVRWISLGERWFRENNWRYFHSACVWYYWREALSPLNQEDF